MWFGFFNFTVGYTRDHYSNKVGTFNIIVSLNNGNIEFMWKQKTLVMVIGYCYAF